MASASSLEDWAERIRAGDRRALARAITVIENHLPAAQPLLKALFPSTGRATIIGVTGPPGSGKSTLVDRLAHTYRGRGETVGIVAVDPTSPYFGGAILGDRIRMQSHHGDDGIFIRSMATRGFLGGLAQATTDVVALLDASGKQRILVETVGVGQDEVDIVKLADVTLVVLVPGMGDEIQAIKAGIMEIADVFVINKADRDPQRLEQELRALLKIAPRSDGWSPPIVRTIASEGRGNEELGKAIDSFLSFLEVGGGLERRRAANWSVRLEQILRERLYRRVLSIPPERLQALARELNQRRRDPYTLADELIEHAIASPTVG